jgi:tryptophan 2,3-dioxygenase
MTGPTPRPAPSDHPIYHDPNLTYGSYLKVPELLALQSPRTSHHDELLFIIAHQVYELWFKQTLHELEGICRALDADQPLRAAALFDRVNAVQHLLIEQIPLLETMFAVDFARFRDALRPASGFQSVQFRQIEFLCGNKNPKMLALIGGDGPDADAARARMSSYLARPTPYDHFLRHLSREDQDVFKVPPDVLSRDTSQPHVEHEGCVGSLEILYRERDASLASTGPSRSGERYYAQFRVAEHLLQFDEKFAIWRFHHVKMVERMIGSRTGTGGSSGAKYLASTVPTPFFPDLWAVRSRFGGGT